MDNQTKVPFFLLLEWSKHRQLQILHFFFFLVLYLATATANILIISAVVFDQRLRTPMYLLLMNLAIQDIGSVTVIVPKSMVNSILGTRYISYFGCVAQVFFNTVFITSDISLLTVMAYDRYVAICNPLQYEKIMNWKACTDMVIAVWLFGFLNALLQTSCTFSTLLCSNVVNQFFCEIPRLMKLSCSEFNLAEVVTLNVVIFVVLGCFLFIIISYIIIFKTVYRIPLVQGRQKAFSTCIPHLIVVSVFYATGCFGYLRQPPNNPSYLEFTFTVLYSFFPPMFNPVVYSMRNKDIKTALSKMWRS